VAKSSKSRVHRLPLTQARRHLGEVVKKAYFDRDYFILEKDGIPVAGIMNVDELEDYLELQDGDIQRQIEEGYEAYRRGEVRDAREFAAELKSETKKARRGKKGKLKR